jgi:hypothetical protein
MSPWWRHQNTLKQEVSPTLVPNFLVTFAHPPEHLNGPASPLRYTERLLPLVFIKNLAARTWARSIFSPFPQRNQISIALLVRSQNRKSRVMRYKERKSSLARAPMRPRAGTRGLVVPSHMASGISASRFLGTDAHECCRVRGALAVTRMRRHGFGHVGAGHPLPRRKKDDLSMGAEQHDSDTSRS